MSDYTRNISFLRHILPRLMKTFQGANGRVSLSRNNNRLIFKYLDKVGCFKFYSTNRGQIIGLSQIVAFLHYGWKAYKNGFTAPKDIIEVHHINGCVWDNTPENLVYLSKEDHQVISDLSYTPFHGKVNHVGHTPFNRQGKVNSNKTHFLVNVIQETITRVSDRRSGIPLTVSFTDVLLNLPKTLWRKANALRVMPTWMTASFQSVLCPSLAIYS